MKKADRSLLLEAIPDVLMFFYCLSFIRILFSYVFFPETASDVYEFTAIEFEPYLVFGGIFFLCGFVRLFFKKKISIYFIIPAFIQLIVWLILYIKNWSFFNHLYVTGFATAENLRNIRIVLLFNVICSALLCIGFIWHRLAKTVRQKQNA